MRTYYGHFEGNSKNSSLKFYQANQQYKNQGPNLFTKYFVKNIPLFSSLTGKNAENWKSDIDIWFPILKEEQSNKEKRRIEF
jgi:predicted nucleotidyltransferase